MNCPKCYEYQDEIKRLKERMVQLEGWKGKDEIGFVQQEFHWEIIVHSKHKETGKITKQIHEVHVDVLSDVKMILEEMFAKEKTLSPRDVWRRLIEHFDMKIEVDSFNGGKNRAKWYFPCYYYPVKILEHLNYLHYSGSGKITKCQ